MINKTKVVATVGPATASYEQLKKLIQNGTDVIRLNLSHASYSFCQDIVSSINELNEELNKSVAIMVDLMGPEIRTGDFHTGEIFLREGDKVEIVSDDIIGSNTKFSINCPNLINEVDFNNIILLRDGLMKLRVVDKYNDSIICEAMNEGFLQDKAKVVIKNSHIKLPFLSQKDKDDIIFATKIKATYLALSHVRSGENILEVSNILTNLNNTNINIVSKIENEEALENIESIIKYSDAISISRGDLGVSIDFERVPGIQKKIINLCHNYGIVSIVSTELMSSMCVDVRPTRAEVSDVANAILDGTDAILLSGETTIGKFPIETLIMLERIISATEKDMDYTLNKFIDAEKDITTSIAKNVVSTVNDLNCKAIITPTMSGYTAKKLSGYRPKCPIIAVSPNIDTVKSLQLHFAVNPVLIDELNDFDKIIKVSKQITRELVKHSDGDKIVITGGYPFLNIKTTNFMEIEEL